MLNAYCISQRCGFISVLLYYYLRAHIEHRMRAWVDRCVANKSVASPQQVGEVTGNVNGFLAY